jgi:hypothetical protein
MAMKRLPLALLLLIPTGVAAAPQDAVVRIPTHGASGIVIATGPGWSLVLTCAHVFEGSLRYRPIALDVPTPAPAAHPQAAGVRLLALDEGADLALVWLNAGPLAYVTPVAPRGHLPGPCVSVGYDDMRLPAVVRPATLLGTAGGTTYTWERPGQGRSGGGLLDTSGGYLVGVVQGYEPDGWGRGLYVSHAAILTFLARHRADLARPPPVGTGPTYYPRPPVIAEHRSFAMPVPRWRPSCPAGG